MSSAAANGAIVSSTCSIDTTTKLFAADRETGTCLTNGDCRPRYSDSYVIGQPSIIDTDALLAHDFTARAGYGIRAEHSLAILALTLEVTRHTFTVVYGDNYVWLGA